MDRHECRRRGDLIPHDATGIPIEQIITCVVMRIEDDGEYRHIYANAQCGGSKLRDRDGDITVMGSTKSRSLKTHDRLHATLCGKIKKIDDGIRVTMVPQFGGQLILDDDCQPLILTGNIIGGKLERASERA